MGLWEKVPFLSFLLFAIFTSEVQIAAFVAIIKGNSRPVQPLYDREVSKHGALAT